MNTSRESIENQRNPMKTHRIPQGFPRDSLRISEGFPKDSLRIPKGFPRDPSDWGQIMPEPCRNHAGDHAGESLPILKNDDVLNPYGFPKDSLRIP